MFGSSYLEKVGNHDLLAAALRTGVDFYPAGSSASGDVFLAGNRRHMGGQIRSGILVLISKGDW